jgi:hypothetical protein
MPVLRRLVSAALAACAALALTGWARRARGGVETGGAQSLS